MILTCPKCSARYRVGTDQVPAGGRNVRCVKCGHIWHQMPVPEEDVPEDKTRQMARKPMGAVHEASFSGEEDEISLWEKIMLIVGWAGVAVIVLLIAWAGYNWRAMVMHSWPQSASVYAALGLSQGTSDLEVSLDPVRRQVVSGHEVLIFHGRVTNVAKHVLVVPQMRAHFLDSTNKELARWSVEAEALTLKPGESTRFATRFHNPPVSARHFEIRFAAPEY